MASSSSSSTSPPSSDPSGGGIGGFFRPRVDLQAFINHYNPKRRRRNAAAAAAAATANNAPSAPTATPTNGLALTLTLKTTRREAAVPESTSSEAVPSTARQEELGGTHVDYQMNSSPGDATNDPQRGPASRMIPPPPLGQESTNEEDEAREEEGQEGTDGGEPTIAAGTCEEATIAAGTCEEETVATPPPEDDPTNPSAQEPSATASDGSDDLGTNSRGDIGPEAHQLDEATSHGDEGNLVRGSEVPADAPRIEGGGSVQPGGTPEGSPAPERASASSWSCPRCTLANPVRSRRCGACHERRPVSVQDNDDTAGVGGNSPTSPSKPTPSRKRKSSSSSPSASPGWPTPQPTTTRRPRRFGGGGRSSGTGRHERRPRSVTKRQDISPTMPEKPPTVPTNHEATGTSGNLPGGYPTDARHDEGSTDWGKEEEEVAPKSGHPSKEGDAATGRGPAGASAVRVSTSPFVSVLPVPASEKFTVVTAGQSNDDRSKAAPASNTPHVPPPTQPRHPVSASSPTTRSTGTEDSAATAGAAAASATAASMLKVVWERYERQNRWYRERVHEGQRRVRHRRDELNRAEDELGRAEREWRAFQIEYDAVRNHPSPATSESATMAPSFESSSNRKAHPASGLREVRFDTPVLDESVARSTSRLSWSSLGSSVGDGTMSPTLLCHEIRTQVVKEPATSQSKTSGTPSVPRSQHRESGAPAPASTNPAHETSDKLPQRAERMDGALHGLPRMRMSLPLTQHSASSSTLSAGFDSQATIDPDLEPHHSLLLKHRAIGAAPSAGTSVKRSDGFVPLSATPKNVTNAAAGGAQEAPEKAGSPLRTMQPPEPTSHKKPPPLSVSTNRTQPAPPTSTWNAVWDSTKSSRDFVGPRAASSAVDTSAAASRAAEAATGEWIQAAKHARQNQRDRSKASEPLWDEDSTQSSPPRQQEPNYKYQEVVRCKADRLNLPCHDCYSCRAFYAALPREDALALLQHSRHRAQHSPSATPQDFWVSDFVDEVEQEQQDRQSDRGE